jgi:hypothetical protein
MQKPLQGERENEVEDIKLCERTRTSESHGSKINRRTKDKMIVRRRARERVSSTVTEQRSEETDHYHLCIIQGLPKLRASKQKRKKKKEKGLTNPFLLHQLVVHALSPQ